MPKSNLKESRSPGLSGRRILITGAAAGIGRATAELFMEEGAQVILLDRNREGLDLTLAGGEGVVAEVDITDDAAVRATVETCAAEIGGIDGVINAAGIMITGATDEVTADTWRRTLDVNLSGTFFVTQSCLPWLRKSADATITNIASGAGILPNAPGLAAYAASKGGVIALTKALAADLAPRIRVNCVCPGMVDTAMADPYRQNVGNYALKRIAAPQEIAEALLFLTSDKAAYVTGVALAVDGGRTFH